jgi:peptidoglycan hydrolase CwlO-like protein
MNIFNKLFGKKVKELEKKLKDVETSLAECNQKLADKQDHINKTNAYWKGKLRMVKKN